MNDAAPESENISPEMPRVAPDIIEQDVPETLDNIIPTRGYQLTPMIGLGGSAGSIQALINFFSAMPPE